MILQTPASSKHHAGPGARREGEAWGGGAGPVYGVRMAPGSARRRARRSPALAVPLLSLLLTAPQPEAQAQPGERQAPAAPPRLAVAHLARAVAPGEAVLLTVTAPGPIEALDVRAFGGRFMGYPGASPATWHALVGIDLDTRPGRARVEIEARTPDGRVLQAAHSLAVARKDFPTRRLSVAPGFVTPPPSERARIERERVRTAQILAEVTPAPLWGEGFVRPAPGAVISLFGARSIYNGRVGSPHRGVDLRGAAGTPVVAPAGGRVALADSLYFSGTTVIIDHGLGIHSMLAHLSRIDVAEGAEVAPGDAIGAIGATGRVTGPHLHWTLRLGSVSVDPMSVLDLPGIAKRAHYPIQPPG